MDKINFQNEVTKVNADTFNTFQNNINKGKVDKSGDTMTGALNIENKSAFSGVNKTRTISGTDYTASFGVGSDGSASLEIHNTSGTLGRIDINTDGKIKNSKTQKYLVEQNAWKTATNNSENITSGYCKYITIGDVLIISIQDVVVKQNLTHGALLFSGLPTNKPDWGFMVNRLNTAKPTRLIYRSGSIYLWYDNITANGAQFYVTTIF